MSQFSQFGGGIPAYPRFSLPYNASDTFTTPLAGWYEIFVVGAGGSGAAAGKGYASGRAGALGGAAGGSSYTTVYLNSGVSLVITIGTGGSAVNKTPPNDFNLSSGINGNSGNITSVIGGSVSMTCNGGAGGTYSNTTNLPTPIAGGNGVGGTLNYTGGHSSSLTVGDGALCSTGGGGVGVWMNGFNSSGGNNNTSAGAGTRSSNGASVMSANGSFGSNYLISGTGIQNTVPNFGNLSSIAGIVLGGGTGKFGEGGSGSSGNPPNMNNSSAGGFLGGGGSSRREANEYGGPGNSASAGGYGGGGGGCVGNSTDVANFNVTSGAGGQGFVIISFMGS